MNCIPTDMFVEAGSVPLLKPHCDKAEHAVLISMEGLPMPETLRQYYWKTELARSHKLRCTSMQTLMISHTS